MEILTEYDTDNSNPAVDEAVLVFENGDWEFQAGNQTLDFGVYYSHFASGPAIEFGETNAYAATLAYNYRDTLDTSLTIYQGDARRINSKNSLDWSMSVEVWPSDNFSFGVSYISDLADADPGLLKDKGQRFQDKVAGLSGYLLWVMDDFEVSLEALGALGDFQSIARDRNEPVAWNLEFVHYLTSKLDWSARAEGSHELEDAPEIQIGIALNYRLHKNIVLTSEVLHGYFDSSVSSNNENRAYDEATTIGALISVAF